MSVPGATPRAETAWREGPPKWVYTAYAVSLATIHLALAGLDIGRYYDLFEPAWPFYASLIAITSGSAVALHLGRRRAARPLGMYDESTHAYPYETAGSYDDTRTLDDLGLPAPPRR